VKTHNKISVSLHIDLLSYIDLCVANHNNDPQNRYCPTDRSKMIQKAIVFLVEKETNQGKPPAKGSAGIVVLPSENSAGGSSTARIKSTRRVGRAI
jgi:hypothetical protein